VEGEKPVSQTNRQNPTPERRRLSEDWISVLIGLVLVALIALFGVTSVPWPLFGLFT
jgi:hypothetical protein